MPDQHIAAPVDLCPCGCGPRATLHLRGFTVVNEEEQALSHIENLLRQGERDSVLLDGRNHNPELYDEAYRLLDLLREKVGPVSAREPHAAPSSQSMAEVIYEAARKKALEAVGDHAGLVFEIEALIAQRDQARYLAKHLFQMIDRETWRATGGDDGQGHFEGDYRAAGIEEEIRSWQ